MVLKNASIDTDTLKAHSVHGASTMAAVNHNILLDNVMKMANWSHISTFQEFSDMTIFKAIYVHSVLKSFSSCP